MRLYLLKPINPNAPPFDPWWDKSFGFVVRAKSEQDAREYAAKERGDEGADTWRDPALTSCEVLPARGEAGVILTDFRNA